MSDLNYEPDVNFQGMIDNLIDGSRGNTSDNFSGNTLLDDNGTNYSRRTNWLWNQLLLHMHNKFATFDNNKYHYGIRESDFPVDKESIVEFINNNIDLDKDGVSLLDKYFNSQLEDNSHWNESIAKLAEYYYNLFKNSNNEDEIDKTNITIKDLKNANAGASFLKDSNWVIPWENIDKNSYSDIRNNDKIKRVLSNKDNLQFTQNERLNQYLRLIIPEYKRIVEIEDINRNFWVIGQALTALCGFLFEDDSPLPQLMAALLDEIAQLWENMFFLWLTLSLLSYKNFYEDIETVFLPISNNEIMVNVKFDNFDDTALGEEKTFEDMDKEDLRELLRKIWEEKMEFLKDKYNNCAIVVFPEIRVNNYMKNYYSKTVYIGCIVYDDSLENEEDWLKFIPFNGAMIIDLKEQKITIPEERSGIEHYGLKIDKNNPDTFGRIEYLYDAVGFTPAHMDYESGKFEYGSWKDTFFVKNNYPVMLKTDGTEDYKLDPNDHTKKLDGTASDVDNLNQSDNAFSCFDCHIWMKFYEDDNYQYIEIANQKLDDDFKDYPYINSDGSFSEKIYYPMYPGYIDSNSRLRSISGVKASANTTTAQEVSYAKNNGPIWSIESWSYHLWFHTLLLLMSKNFNSQVAFGNGNISGTSQFAIKENGLLNGSGQFLGYNTNSDSIKAFYCENVWGNRWSRCLGMYNVDNTYKIKMIPPYTYYEKYETYISIEDPQIPTNDGYIKDFSFNNSYGFVPKNIGGSAEDYVGDILYQSHRTNLLQVGGGWNEPIGTYCGSWSLDLSNMISFLYSCTGASLYLQLAASYDESRIAVVLLDENSEPTDQIEYFYTIRSAQSYMYSADSSNRYLLYIGENAGITELAQNALASTTTLREVRIPDSVISIGVAAFQDCSNLAAIDGMNEISSIGNNAFSGCASLKSVNLPDTLITIGHGVFKDSGLTSIIIPDSVTSELYQICLGCTDLESATIGASVSKIYTNAFKDCTSLTNVLIKDGVSEINNNSFYNCLSLTSISIPHSVSVMDVQPFTECTNLSEIIVDAKWGDITPTYWYPPTTSYCWGAPNATITWTRGYPAIKIMNGSSVVKYTNNIGEASNFVHNGSAGDKYYVEISGDTIISVAGFANSQYLYGISMNADSITTIADGACYGCYNLTTVEIGTSVSSIGSSSFANCTNLSTIKINQPENSISGAPWGATNAQVIWVNESLYDETKIAAVLLDLSDSPTDEIRYFDVIADAVTHVKNNSSNRYLIHIGSDSGVTSLANAAFYQCINLILIDIPNTITSLGYSVFYGCSGLKEIVVPSSISVISGYTFQGCSALSSVDLPDGMTSIDSNAFYECLALESINIPSTVTNIGTHAFDRCSSLKSITIPAGVSSMNEGVFRDCSNLENIMLLGDVTLLDYGAFANCTSLSSIAIPNTVTYIGTYAFAGCTSLESITIPSSVTTISEYALATSSLTTITVNKLENSIEGAPWGATNAQIIWTG